MVRTTPIVKTRKRSIRDEDGRVIGYSIQIDVITSGRTHRKNQIKKSEHGNVEFVRKKWRRFPIYANTTNSTNKIHKHNIIYRGNPADNKKKRLPHSNPWGLLEDKYGEEVVDLTRWFLETQQINHPKVITGKITPLHPRVSTSAKTLSRLLKIEGYDFNEVKTLIEYVPRDPFWRNNLLSLSTLRTKSKNGEIKFVNIANSLADQIEKEEPASNLIRHKFKKDPKLLKAFVSRCFEPACDLFTYIDNVMERGIGTHTLEIYDWAKANQKRPKERTFPNDYAASASHMMVWKDIIPTPLGVVSEFVKYLGKQNFGGEYNLTVGHFKLMNNTFKRFVETYQKEIGYDILTGRSLQ